MRWAHQGDWAGSLFVRGAVYAGLGREVPRWTGVSEGTEAFLQAGPATWLQEGAFARFAEAYLKRARAAPSELIALAEESEGVMDRVRDLGDRLAGTAPRSGDPAAIAAACARLEMQSQPYSYVFGYGEDRIVARLVRDAAEAAGREGSEADAWVADLLSHPAEVPTETQAAQDDALDIAIEAEELGWRAGAAAPQHAALRARIDAHVARFGSVSGDADAVLATIRHHVPGAARVRDRRRAESAARERAFEERLAALKPDAEHEALLRCLRRQVGVRTQRRERWNRLRAAAGPHLRALEADLGLAEDEVHLLTHEELAAAAAGGRLPDLAARRDGCALLALRGELFVFTGEDAARLHAHARAAGESSGRARGQVRELRGLGASPGVVRGTARIVLGPADGDKVRRGDVLVSDMTQPDLVLACERAVAIVTDLGGMLCHAAVVSRELGIPCVLGTGDATRALRDGDTVEVDGAAGVVRVLQRVEAGR